MRRNNLIDLTKLVASIIVCQLAGLIGSLATAPAIPTWYAGLRKPFYTPPSWVFAPVWITLYAMMGISLFLVWRRGLDTKEVKAAVLAFTIQLALNALWSVAFFGLTSPMAGLMVITLLWLAIVYTIKAFRRVSPASALLLAPYLLWVSFAGILNLSILALNL